MKNLKETRSDYHLPKKSGNSGSFVPLEIFQNKPNFWNGSPVFPVETFQWKFVFHLQISRLYHRFHTFCGLLSGQASLGSLDWNSWQLEHSLPKRKFPIDIFGNFLKMENVPECFLSLVKRDDWHPLPSHMGVNLSQTWLKNNHFVS